jgi:glycerol-3-phosphate acyltransferase PlsX
VAFKELKENPDAKAFVSAGSTGAVLVGATLKLGRIRGVNRPALCPVMPTIQGDKKVILLDAGANADCKAINLIQFALMGTVYAESLGVEDQKVALLSNGTEDEKGNMLNHEVFPVLKSLKGINFVGNCEARDILSGKYDVVVADGFAGNVALKSMEGAISTVMKTIKAGIYSSPRGKIGGIFLKKVFADIKDKLDYSNKGGALFLGVNKPVIKPHGSSGRVAIKNTVLQAADYANFNISEKITEKLSAEEIVIGE